MKTPAGTESDGSAAEKYCHHCYKMVHLL
ncbi:hypothetical protein J4710_09105 [Staphylococcus xylosus]|uniref:Putative zinc ribbon domain-containing protein n=1 Tax=Staphylococcus xylosus TaxID=1288 RepID=A0A939SK25_STAXY|nr:hypothetical protein [Staphylococcus xylosus]